MFKWLQQCPGKLLKRFLKRYFEFYFLFPEPRRDLI